MTEFTLVRHGETDWNRDLIIQGRYDIPLNDTGIEQAKQAARDLKRTDYDTFFATPLIRTKQTAIIIAKAIGFDDAIMIHEDLIERDFGAADGKPIEGIYDDVLAGKVDGMESDEAIEARVINALKEIAMDYPHERILVVCHSHVIKAVLASLDPKTYDYYYRLNNGSLTDIRYHHDQKQFELVSVNYNESYTNT